MNRWLEPAAASALHDLAMSSGIWSPPGNHDPTVAFEKAQQRLFAACGVTVGTRYVRLADPSLAVRVLETGEGPPLLLVHGSGMSASTWAPLMAHLPGIV